MEARTVFPILVVTFDDVFRKGPLISTMILRPISKMFACPCYFRQVRVGPAIVIKKFFACEEPLETDTHVPNHMKWAGPVASLVHQRKRTDVGYRLWLDLRTRKRIYALAHDHPPHAGGPAFKSRCSHHSFKRLQGIASSVKSDSTDLGILVGLGTRRLQMYIP